jgi:hypothetical protein
MVVWASVPDRNGVVKSDPRPLLITSVHPTLKNAPFVAHCISTRTENSSDDPIIEMPWDKNTGGGVGLFRWCAVVLKWSVIVDQDQVVDCTGKVSREFLESVLSAIHS